MTTEYIDKTGKPFAVESEAVASQSGPIFTVRVNSDGNLYDPTNRDHDGGLTKKEQGRGRLRFVLKRCGQACFDSYMQFLKTKNRAHLRVAEREYCNHA